MSRSSLKVARAAAWSIGGSGTQYIVSFLLLVYLAHVLEPRDFGLMATVSIGLDLGTRIARWGQVELLQQERYRGDQARNQSFRLSLAIGSVFSVLFLALARPLGDAYHSPQLALMMLICAPVFLLSAPGATAEALLRTEFRFNVIAVRNSVTSLIGAIAAATLIRLGYGVVGLAVQRLIQAAVASAWIWAAVAWRPRLFGRLGWSPQLFHEGTHIMLGTLMPLLVPRSVDLFVGAFIGAAELGLMRVGTRINDFVGQVVVMPLVSVANTHLSSLHGDLRAMRRSYLRLTQASALLMCPSLVGLSLVAPEAIPLLFGSKWVGAVPFVEVVGLLGVVAPINYYFAPTMMALGQSRLVFRQGLLQVAVGIGLALIGAQISLFAVAVANVLRGTIVAIWNLIELRSAMRLNLADVGAYLAPPYLGTLAMAATLLILRTFVGGELSAFERLAVLSASGALVYLAVLIAGGRFGLWPEHASLRVSALARRAVPAE
jgi:O-antigen/teichoic acid export membrane protein